MSKSNAVLAFSAMTVDEAGQRGDHWSADEIDETAFADIRLGRRLGEIVKRLGDHIGESVPYACDDWASTKAAYRFLPIRASARPTYCRVILARRRSVLRHLPARYF